MKTVLAFIAAALVGLFIAEASAPISLTNATISSHSKATHTPHSVSHCIAKGKTCHKP